LVSFVSGGEEVGEMDEDEEEAAASEEKLKMSEEGEGAVFFKFFQKAEKSYFLSSLNCISAHIN
jgi:hypothetical protein